MYLTEFDRSQRLMKITVAGDTIAEEVRSALENLRTLLIDVQPGFRVLADLSGLVSMPTSVAPHIGEVMDLCAEKGVALAGNCFPRPQQRHRLSDHEPVPLPASCFDRNLRDDGRGDAAVT